MLKSQNPTDIKQYEIIVTKEKNKEKGTRQTQSHFHDCNTCYEILFCLTCLFVQHIELTYSG